MIHKELVSRVSPGPSPSVQEERSFYLGIQSLLISFCLNRLGCHMGREALVRVAPAVCPCPVAQQVTRWFGNSILPLI